MALLEDLLDSLTGTPISLRISMAMVIIYVCGKALYDYYESQCNDPDAIPNGPDIEINVR